MVVVKLRIDAHGCHGGFGQLQIGVRTDRIVFQTDIVLEIVTCIVAQHAVVDVECSGQIEARDASAARNIGVETLVHGVRLDQLVDPVVIRIKNPVGATTGLLYFVLRINQRRLWVARERRFVGQFHVGNVVGETQVARIGRNRILRTEIELCRTFAAALGIDQHHTVGTAGAVYRRGSGILQHGEIGDVVGLKTCQIGRRGFDAVDQDQRIDLAGTERTHSADEKLGVVLTRFAAARRSCRRSGRRASS